MDDHSFRHVMIRFEIGCFGWSSIDLTDGNNEIQIVPTHVFDDPIVNLLDFTSLVIESNFPCAAFFQDEPGSHCFKIETKSDGRHPVLSVYEADENHALIEKMTRVAEFRVVPSYFVTQVIAGMERMEVLYQHSEHKKDRNPFPRQEYRALKEKWIKTVESP